jgi:AcrR family transcriptional regulator
MLTFSPGNAESDDVELGPAKAECKHDPRTEIMRSSSEVIASRGVCITMRQIAQSSGKSFGALNHHFDSKGDLLIELVKRYQADLTRVGENAQARLDRQGRRSTFDQLAGMPGRDKRTGVMGARNGDRDIGNPHPGVGQVGKELLVECQRRRGRQGLHVAGVGSGIG